MPVADINSIGYKMGGKVDQTACSPRKRAAMGVT